MSILDTFQNVVSGLGMFGKDKSAHATIVFNNLNRSALTQAYRGSWIAKKAVNIPAFDMTRAWRTFQVDKDKINLLVAEEKRLGIRAKVRKAIVLARLHGGSAIILDDGQRDTTRPLRVTGKGGLKSVIVQPMHKVIPGPLIIDLADPDGLEFGTPGSYSLSTGGRLALDLHPSRVITFMGAEIPDEEEVGGQATVYGDSILSAGMDAILHAAGTNQAIAALIEEAKSDVIKIPGLMGKVLNKEFRDQLAERWQLAAVLKSIANVTLIDAAEEWESRTQTFAGLTDVQAGMLQVVSGAFDIPATRMLGQAPKGLNATGDSDLQNYDQMISAGQDNEITPRLDRIDDALYISALGAKPEGAHSRWNPLRVMTEEQQSKLRKEKIDTVKILADTGLVPTAALETATQNMLIEDGWLPGLEQAIEESKKGLLLPFEDPADDQNDIDPATGQPYAEDDPRSMHYQAAQAANENEPREITVNGGKVAIKAKVKRPAPGKAQDATPRPLYVSRRLLNAAEFRRWAVGQGFKNVQPDLHVTVAFSRAPVDWMKVPQDYSWNDADGNLTVRAGGPRIVEGLGPEGKAIALLFRSSDLEWRHTTIKEAGATWDHEGYQPHVTITWDAEGVDIAKVEPFQGVLRFGPEIFEEIVEDWAKKAAPVPEAV